MPTKLICCVSLPPATISTVPIIDYAKANVELANKGTIHYYSCCGKNICGRCVHSFRESGNIGKCPHCNADRKGKTEDDLFEEMMNRVEANYAVSICMLAHSYHQGIRGVKQDHANAIELFTRAAVLVVVRHIGTCMIFIIKGEI